VISIFDGMKVSLDLATALSVIIAMLMYMWEQKKARERKDQEEVRAALERTRVSFKDRKDYFINMALQLSDLYEAGEQEEIIREFNKALGEIVFFLEILINEIENEYKITAASVRDAEKRIKLQASIKNAIHDLRFKIVIGTMILNSSNKNIKICFDDSNKENAKMFVTAFIRILCMQNTSSSDDVIEINKQMNPNDRLSEEEIEKLKNISDSFDYGIIPTLDKCFADIAKLSSEE